MGVKFLHTADLQIGMRAAHVAQVADHVRRARIETAGRIATLAKERNVDFVLVAGDLFEDNAVGNDVVHQVLHAFEKATPVPVYILPGNHDLLIPGAVYGRAAFRSGPGNVHVLRSTDPVLVADGKAALLPAPIGQKQSERDPTSVFADTAPSVGATIRIGVAHGSPRIEGMYQPDDHPIAIDAAERYGLDYLALGHWHSWLTIGSRTLMPGTPEPTKFGETSGFVAIVTINAPAEEPVIEQISIAGLRWAEQEFDVEIGPEALDRQVKAWFDELGAPDRTLVRVRLSGPLTPHVEEIVRELRDWLGARALYSEIDTRGTSLALTEGRLHEIAAAHPFLAGLLSDLSTLSTLASPAGPFDGFRHEAAAAADAATAGEIDVGELRTLLAEAGLELDSDVVAEALRQLSHRAGEVFQ